MLQGKLARILVIVGLVLLVGAAGLTWIASQLEFDAYRPQIIDAVFQATGFEMAIEGELRLDLGLHASVVAEGIVLRNPNPRWSSPVARARRLELVIDLWQAIRHGLLQLDHAILEDLDIELIADAEGEANWRAAAPPRAAAPHRPDDAFRFEIASADAQRVQIHYLEAASQTRRSLELDAVRIRDSSREGFLNAHIAGRVGSEPFEVTAEVVRHCNVFVEQGERCELEGRLAIEGGDLQVEGSIGGATETRGVDLRVTAQLERLAPLLRAGATEIEMDIGSIGPVTARAQLRSQAGRIDVEALDVTAGVRGSEWFHVEGELRDVSGAHERTLDFELATPAFDASLARFGLAPLGLAACDAQARIVGAGSALVLQRAKARCAHPDGAALELTGALSYVGGALEVTADARLSAERLAQVRTAADRWLPARAPASGGSTGPLWRRLLDDPAVGGLGPLQATGGLHWANERLAIADLHAEIGHEGGEWAMVEGALPDAASTVGLDLGLTAQTHDLPAWLDRVGVGGGLQWPERGQFTGRLHEHASALQLTGVDARVQGGHGLDIRARGDVGPLESIALRDWQVSLEADRIAPIAAFLDRPLPQTARLNATARVTWAEGRLTARALDVRAGESRATGSLDWAHDRMPRPRVDLSLHSTRLRLADLGVAPKKVPAEGPTGKSATAGEWPDVAPLPFDDLLLLDAKVEVETAELIGRAGLRVENVRLALDIENGVLRTRAAQLRWEGGHVEGFLGIDATAAPPTQRVRLRVTGANLHQVIAQLTTDEVATGTLEVSADLASRGRSERDLLEALQGDVFVHVTEGTLVTRYSRALQVDVLRQINPDAKLAPVEVVHCLVSDFEAKAGVFGIRTLLLDTADKQILSQGSIDLPKATLDLTVMPIFKTASFTSVAASISVKGPARDPHVTVKPFSTASAATRAKLEQAVRPVRRFMPRLGKAIDGVRRGAQDAAGQAGVDAIGDLLQPGVDVTCDAALASERIQRARSLHVDEPGAESNGHAAIGRTQAEVTPSQSN